MPALLIAMGVARVADTVEERIVRAIEGVELTRAIKALFEV
jgi:hypothetical protein